MEERHRIERNILKTKQESCRSSGTPHTIFWSSHFLTQICVWHIRFVYSSSILISVRGRPARWAAVFNVFLQMFHVRHWTDCLQEAGAGTGDSFQRNSRVPGRRREAAAQGTHFQLCVSLRMTASHSSDRWRAIIRCFLSIKCLPIRKSYLRDAFSSRSCDLYLKVYFSWLFLSHTDDKVSEENHVSGTQWHFHRMAISWDQRSPAVSCGQHLPVSRGQSDWLQRCLRHHPLPRQSQICKCQTETNDHAWER